jgi:hypothetical protein
MTIYLLASGTGMMESHFSSLLYIHRWNFSLPSGCGTAHSPLEDEVWVFPVSWALGAHPAPHQCTAPPLSPCLHSSSIC